jgi:hypothetical protein
MAFGRQRDEGDVRRHDELVGQVPTGLVEEEQSVTTRRHGQRDLGQMQVHRRDVIAGQDKGGALAVLGADGAEDIGRGGALIVWRGGARTAPLVGSILALITSPTVKRNAIAASEDRTFLACAALPIIDAPAVALVEAALGAETPDRVLHEAREIDRKSAIEAPRVDLGGDAFDDCGAPIRVVAPRAIGMIGIEASQDAGAVQKIVNQPVDGDQHGPGLDPAFPSRVAGEQQPGERHREDFVGDAVDVPERLEQSLPQAFSARL